MVINLFTFKWLLVIKCILSVFLFLHVACILHLALSKEESIVWGVVRWSLDPSFYGIVQAHLWLNWPLLAFLGKCAKTDWYCS